MSETSQTAAIQTLVQRLAAGDARARDDLLQHASGHLLRVTRKMLRDFPAVKRWEQTDDVFQNAAIRFYRALEHVELVDARHFFRLAALHIRRELIDMARHYNGPQGAGAHHATQGAAAASGAGLFEPAELSLAPQRLAEWAEFHQCVDRLPEEQRDVFDLLWYHGLSQDEAASMLDIDVRTIKRRWRCARLFLHDRLDGEQPGA